MGRRVVVLSVVLLQLGLAVRGYSSDHKPFAFQMFPESSTWRADVVRVTTDGRRVPIESPWSGYRWDDLVRDVGLQDPSVRRHADAGLANQLAFLRSALDWVADNTPRDHDTRYLEATVTSRHNDDPPRVEVFRSRVGGGEAATVRAPVWSARGRRAARAAGQHAVARVAAGAGRPDRAAASATVPRPTRWHGRIYRDAFFEPYAAWYPDLPRAVYVALLWLAAVAAVAMALGLLTRLATATTFAIVAYNLFLSTTHFHNNRAYLVIVLGAAGRGALRAGAVRRRLDPPPPRAAGTRSPRTRPGRCGCCGSSAPRSTRASGHEQAARSRLVRRHRPVAARGGGPR